MRLLRPFTQVILSLLSLIAVAFCLGASSRLFASSFMAGWRWIGWPV